ncbi:hypothetical protein B0H14DRAFT_2705844, partial [Mycena olivaceomarginata]
MTKKSLAWTPIGPVFYFSGCVLVDRGSGGRAVASLRKAGSTLRAADARRLPRRHAQQSARAHAPTIQERRVPPRGAERASNRPHRVR